MRIPPRAPRKGSGEMRSPFATRVRVDSPCGCESHPFRTRRDGREVKTPGPQPGGRGSIPRRGTHTPNQCQVVERQDVRLLPGRRGFDPLPGSATLGGREVQARGLPIVGGAGACPCDRSNARWPRSSGAWLQTTRRGCDSRPGVHRKTRGRRPTARMPVRHIGDEGSSPSDHTQYNRSNSQDQRKGARCPPTSTTS